MATLKARFEELIHLTWSEFVALETDKHAIVDDSVLCSLIRTCAETDDISAIKLAFDRIEGLQETLIDIKVPKFFVRYVNAKDIEPAAAELPEGEKSETKEEPNNFDPATAKLRATLKEMRRMPKMAINLVIRHRKKIDKGEPADHDPMVKSVIVANLLKNVQKGKFKAVELVFDQIDGKLPKAIKLLGGADVYVDDDQELVAPAHAELGEDGVYFAENKVMTTAWLRGFAQSQKGLEILAEGLDDE